MKFVVGVLNKKLLRGLEFGKKSEHLSAALLKGGSEFLKQSYYRHGQALSVPGG